MRRGLLKDLAGRASLVAFGVVLGFALGEIVLRAIGARHLARQEAENRASIRRAGHYRVLCVGESTTAAVMVRRQDSYPGQLERILNERGNGLRFSVVNAGIPATNTTRILQALPGYLEKYDPHIVVSMMGTNDGPEREEYPVSGRLRILKLARLLYHRLRGRSGTDGSLSSELERVARGEVPIDTLRERSLRELIEPHRELDEISRMMKTDAERALRLATELAARHPDPLRKLAKKIAEVQLRMHRGEISAHRARKRTRHLVARHQFWTDRYLVARHGTQAGEATVRALVWRMAAAGKLDDADALARRYLAGAAPVDRGRNHAATYGQLALLEWSRGNSVGAEHYHDLARAWHERFHNPTTKRSYQELRRLLRARGIRLVAVQYPMRPLSGLRSLLEDDPDAAYVDNEEAFVRALRTTHFKRLFADLFAGDFGHLTPEGNRLIAENVAAAILRIVGVVPEGTRGSPWRPVSASGGVAAGAGAGATRRSPARGAAAGWPRRPAPVRPSPAPRPTTAR
jgi:lysophospholipase L1-like esterase